MRGSIWSRTDDGTALILIDRDQCCICYVDANHELNCDDEVAFDAPSYVPPVAAAPPPPGISVATFRNAMLHV